MGSMHKGHAVASSQSLTRGSKRKALLLVGTACLLLAAFKSSESGRSLQGFTGADVHLLEGAEGKEVPEWRKLPVKPDYSRWKVSRDNAAKRGKEAGPVPDILPTQGAGATQITALEAAARIEDNYLRVRKEKSDINEHLGTLRDLARDSTHVAELGVRTMVSTWALLQGLLNNNQTEKHLLSVDLEPVPGIQQLVDLAAAAGVDHRFRQRSSLKLDLDGPVDLLFIDTFHVYGQLKRELGRFQGQVRRYIAMHDTEVDAEEGEFVRMQQWGLPAEKAMYNEWAQQSGLPDAELRRGVQPAIDEFLGGHKQDWRVLRRDTNNNGLVVLVRRTEGETGTAVA